MYIPTELYERSGTVEADAAGLKETMQSITDGLQAKGGVVTQIADAQVRFDSHIWFPGWELLVPVSGGQIEVVLVGEKATITYRLSFWRSFVFCIIFTTLILMAPLIAPLPWQIVPLAIAGVWGWVYLMNVVVTSAKFRRFLKKSVRNQ